MRDSGGASFYCRHCQMQVDDIRLHNGMYHGEPMDVREARRIVNEYECRTQGHSWDVVETLGGGPEALICVRCGVRLRVVAEDPATV